MNTSSIFQLSKKAFLSLFICLSSFAVLLGQQNLIWAKHFGSAGYDRITDVTFDAAGNIYSVGRFEGTVDMDPGHTVFNLTANGGSDVFITKSDASGNFIWACGFGGSGLDIGNVIKTDASGNIYVAGIFNNTANFYNGSPTLVNLSSNGNDDIFYLKLNSSGNVSWAKSVGGTGQDFLADMVIDAAGNIFSTGSFNNTVDFDPGPAKNEFTSAGGWDVFITEMTTNGDLTMASRVGDGNFDSGWGIALDQGGNIFVVGSFAGTVDFNPGHGNFRTTSAGSDDVFILKLDPLGNFLWAKQQGGTNWENPGNIETDVAGNVYVSGRFMGTTQMGAGSGVDYNFTAVGFEDYYVSKFDGSGHFLWAKQIGSSANDFGTVMVDPLGNIFLSGKFANTVDLDPGPGSYYATTGGTDGIFITQLSPSGNFVCGGAIKGTGNTESVLKLNSGDVFVAGSFENTADLNPGSGVDTLSSAGLMDAFLVKLSSCASASVEDPIIEGSVAVYPNPSSGKFRINGGKESLVEVKVYNLLGNEIMSKSSHTAIEEIDLSNQPKGIYFINMTFSGKEKLIERVVVQ